MVTRPFLIAWTGHGLNVGFDRYGLAFTLDGDYPRGLRLMAGWSLLPTPAPVDPLSIPDVVIELARAAADTARASWGSQSGHSLLEEPRPHPIWHDPTLSPGFDIRAVRTLIDLMHAATEAPHRP